MGFYPDPKHLIVNFEQYIVKYAEKWEGGGEGKGGGRVDVVNSAISI